MILLLRRDQLSYFQSYKDYFLAIYLAFLGFPVADLIIIVYPQPALSRLATQILVTSGGSIAIIWGYVATKLYTYPEPLSLKRFVAGPFRPIFLLYAIYLMPMVLVVLLVWTDPSVISTG